MRILASFGLAPISVGRLLDIVCTHAYNHCVDSEYQDALAKLTTRKIALAAQRQELEIQLHDTDAEILNLDKAIARVRMLMGMAQEGEHISELGITDAIRRVVGPERMSAGQIREKLEAEGFKLSDYTNPMSSIYTVLSRLEKSGELLVEREDWNAWYRRRVRARRSHFPRPRTTARSVAQDSAEPPAKG
jgi:hypothetical protein